MTFTFLRKWYINIIKSDQPSFKNWNQVIKIEIAIYKGSLFPINIVKDVIYGKQILENGA